MADRKFLHDLANASMIASGMLNSALKILNAANTEPKAIEKLNKALAAIQKIEKAVTEERQRCLTEKNSAA